MEPFDLKANQLVQINKALQTDFFTENAAGNEMPPVGKVDFSSLKYSKNETKNVFEFWIEQQELMNIKPQECCVRCRHRAQWQIGCCRVHVYCTQCYIKGGNEIHCGINNAISRNGVENSKIEILVKNRNFSPKSKF